MMSKEETNLQLHDERIKLLERAVEIRLQDPSRWEIEKLLPAFQVIRELSSLEIQQSWTEALREQKRMREEQRRTGCEKKKAVCKALALRDEIRRLEEEKLQILAYVSLTESKAVTRKGKSDHTFLSMLGDIFLPNMFSSKYKTLSVMGCFRWFGVSRLYSEWIFS